MVVGRISNCLQQHEYLRDTLIPTYKDCSSCNTRTQFTCVKCGYCYSCHWKMEETERTKPKRSNFTVLEKYSQPATIAVEQSPPSGKQMAIDVYGQQIEPICNYRTCNHKFSTHGHSSRTCKCHHALNYAAGISLRTVCMAYD